MSITGLSSHHNNNKIHKKSFHWRNNSGELDVFEAARYFSSTNDQNPGAKFSDSRQNIQTRMSLDMPFIRNPIIPPEFHHDQDKKQPKSENKKYKQPSSPGGRLASFLNSLFNQTSLKKNKSKPGKDFEDETTPGGRRKRRSSISHFRIITSNAVNSVSGDNNSKKSGYANTPTKSYRATSSVKNGDFKTALEDEICAEKTRVSRENNVEGINFGFSNWKPLKFSDADDYPDSDSSSDLFDLPNHELDFYSSGLPVYETTHMDRIKIVAPISRATTV